MKLIGGNLNYSSWTLRPWYLLTQADIEFEFERILLSTPSFKTEVARFAPNGKVPILKDGDITLWESLAICEYINEREGGGLWPSPSAARALARAISCEMHAGFMHLRNALPVNVRARRHVPMFAELQSDIQRIESIWNDARSRFGAAGPWLFGSFSIADAMYMPVASRFLTYGIALEGEAGDYVRHIQQSSGYQILEGLAGKETEIVAEDEAGTPR